MSDLMKSIFRMILADPAAAAELQAAAASDTAPTPVKKRKGNPEALKRWREQQKAKKAAAPAKAAKPKPAAESVKQKPAAKPATWAVKPHTTAKGVKGRIVTVGPFSTWIEDGDDDKAQAALDAINLVFRSAQAQQLADAIIG